jgi:hypothetical protein
MLVKKNLSEDKLFKAGRKLVLELLNRAEPHTAIIYISSTHLGTVPVELSNQNSTPYHTVCLQGLSHQFEMG